MALYPSNSKNSSKNVPAFLNKLYSMVDDPESNELITWSEDGNSFLVKRPQDFAKVVLPKFFKHNNFSSFVRQLNMYGFHKIPHLQQGVLQSDVQAEEWEFSNSNFIRNQPDLLLFVSRKKGKDTDIKEDVIDMNYILNEITSIKKHLVTISTDLKNVQRDNQILWQETLTTRERYRQQQDTINKIVRFLSSVFTVDKKRSIVPPKRRRLLIGNSDTDYGTDLIALLDNINKDDTNLTNNDLSINNNTAITNLSDIDLSSMDDDAAINNLSDIDLSINDDTAINNLSDIDLSSINNHNNSNLDIDLSSINNNTNTNLTDVDLSSLFSQELGLDLNSLLSDYVLKE